MTTTQEYKTLVQNEVDSLRDKLIAISNAIHATPELGLREFKACELLTSEAESFWFRVENPIAGLDKAIMA